MLNIIDISSWQGNIELAPIFASKYNKLDGCVVKVSESTYYHNPYANNWLNWLISNKKPCGFYHYAKRNAGTVIDDARRQCEFFIELSKNYIGKGIPVLDWEENDISAEWVNAFVRTYHDMTGTWPVIYANPWRFNGGNIESNCGRWIASYPDWLHPSFDMARNNEHPACNGLVCMWQFCDDGLLNGYNGDLDMNVFYGDEKAWKAYATGKPQETKIIKERLKNEHFNVVLADYGKGSDKQVIDGKKYRVTIERK